MTRPFLGLYLLLLFFTLLGYFNNSSLSNPETLVPAGVLAFVVMTFLPVLPRWAEMTLDREGLTLASCRLANGHTTSLHISWDDTIHIGFLRRHGLSEKQSSRRREHILVVRMRTEDSVHVAVDPGTVTERGRAVALSRGLSRGLHGLGYRNLGSVILFRENRSDFLGALDRFAAHRVLHTEDEFTARDPRITRDMF